MCAVGLATIAIFLVNAFFLVVLNGVKVVSAQATGADQAALATRSGWQGALLSVPFGMAVIALGALADPIFELLGGTGDRW